MIPAFTSRLEVHPVATIASDVDVVAAAQVSTKGSSVFEDYIDTDGSIITPERAEGMVNFLMSKRHGSVFEHNMFRFFVSAPIAVFREFHRHRIGFSYNEESGRYKQLDGKFYVPPRHRPLVQVGKPGHYTFVPGTDEQHEQCVHEIKTQCEASYAAYERMLESGIAKEVARGVLPVYIFSSMWVTCNARSLMSFLSLRTTIRGHADHVGADLESATEPLFPSFPMWEIEQVALQMEDEFAATMPITHAAFRRHGSVCP